MITRKEAASELPVVIGLALAVTLIAFIARPRGQSGQLIPQASREAMPALLVTQLDGKPWRLGDHRGQVVLINYWATWCGPCREELPGLAKLARDTGPRGLAVIGISLDKGDHAAVQSFADHYRLPYPIAFANPLSPVDTGMFGIPTTILVDRSGLVAKTYTGSVPRADFESDVDQLLNEDVLAHGP